MSGWPGAERWSSAGRWASRLFGFALLLATPAGLYLGLTEAQRFIGLGFHGAALEQVTARYNGLVGWSLAALVSLGLVTWLAQGGEGRGEAAGRAGEWLQGARRIVAVFVAFQVYLWALGSLASSATSPHAVVPLHVAALTLAILWVYWGPRGRWEEIFETPLARGLHLAGALACVLWLGCNLATAVRDVSVALRAHPNVVLVVVEGLRADRVDSGTRLTPALDAFARKGVLFQRALAQSTWTYSSLGSVLASRHPAEFGFSVSERRAALLDDTLYLGELLSAAGYETHAILSDPEAATLPRLESGLDHLDTTLARAERAEPIDPRVTDRALAALEGMGSGPFFLLVEYSDPQLPYVVDPTLRDRHLYRGPLASRDTLETLRLYARAMSEEDRAYVRAAYDEQVARTDAAIGRLLAALEARADYDSTVVVVLSTHGVAHFERGPDSIGAGHSLFDELIHVPLIVRFPGAESGIRVAHAVALIDVVPTLQAHLQLPTPPGHTFAGRIIDLARIAAFDGLPPAPISAETRFGARRLQAADLGRWKYIRELHSGSHWLFERESDPGEKRDVSIENPDVVAQLDRVLDRWFWRFGGDEVWSVGARVLR